MKGAWILCILLAVYSVEFANGQPKIKQGQVAQPGQFPFYVMIFYRNIFLCGGSILYPNVVLTSADCLVLVTDPEEVAVFYGGNKLTNSRAVEVANIIVHPNFTFTGENQIALLILATNLEFDSTVGSIPYKPYLDSTFRNTSGNLTIVGFGGTAGLLFTNFTPNVDGISSVYLRWENVPSIFDDECNASFSLIGLPTDRHLCTNATQSGTCLFDWGGPVVFYPNLTGTPGLTAEQPYLVGMMLVTLDLLELGLCYLPANRHLRISSYGDWIDSVLPASASASPTPSVTASASPTSSGTASRNPSTSSTASSSGTVSFSGSVTGSSSGSRTLPPSAIACTSIVDDPTCRAIPYCRYSDRQGFCRYNCHDKAPTVCVADPRCRLNRKGQCRTMTGF